MHTVFFIFNAICNYIFSLNWYFQGFLMDCFIIAVGIIISTLSSSLLAPRPPSCVSTSLDQHTYTFTHKHTIQLVSSEILNSFLQCYHWCSVQMLQLGKPVKQFIGTYNLLYFLVIIIILITCFCLTAHSMYIYSTYIYVLCILFQLLVGTCN